MILLRVRHTTVYSYRRPVRLGEHRLMLRPRDSHDLRLASSRLAIEPRPELRWMHDVFSNSIAVADFERAPAVERLSIDSDMVVEHYAPEALEYPIETYARHLPFSYPPDERPDLGRSAEPHYSDPDHRVGLWAQRFLERRGSSETWAVLTAMTEAIGAEITYERRDEEGVQSPVETLERGAGSCRDIAVLLMEAARHLGLAARFVSGYLYDPANDSGGGLLGTGTTHAWAQIYLPGAGWVEFDPTNGIVGGPSLIRVAVVRDPAQCVPVSGAFFGDAADATGLEVNVTVSATQHAQVA